MWPARCALVLLLLSWWTRTNFIKIIKKSYQHDVCVKIASITFWENLEMKKSRHGNGQRIISYVIKLPRSLEWVFLIMEKCIMRKLREWLNLQQKIKMRSEMDKKEKLALASFVRCNPQMKVFRKCYAITSNTYSLSYIHTRLCFFLCRDLCENFSETTALGNKRSFI